MKKIVFTLSALLTITLATAQSYHKQPDPKVYNVIRHDSKSEKATEAEEEKEAVATTGIQEARREDQENVNREVTETESNNQNGLVNNDNQ